MSSFITGLPGHSRYDSWLSSVCCMCWLCWLCWLCCWLYWLCWPLIIRPMPEIMYHIAVNNVKFSFSNKMFKTNLMDGQLQKIRKCHFGLGDPLRCMWFYACQHQIELRANSIWRFVWGVGWNGRLAPSRKLLVAIRLIANEFPYLVDNTQHLAHVRWPWLQWPSTLQLTQCGKFL